MSLEGISRFPVLHATAGVSATAAVATVANAMVGGHPVTWNHGCGDDGWAYCLMAAGRLVTPEASRRILLPTLLRPFVSTIDTAPRAFFLANLVGLVVAAAVAVWLTYHLARGMSAPRGRAVSAAITCGSVFFIMPMGFTWIHYYPTLVDDFAAGLAALWFVAAVRRAPAWLSTAIACLVVATKEFWLPVILLVMWAQYLLERTPSRFRSSVLSTLALQVTTIGVMVAPTATVMPAPPTAPTLRPDLATNWQALLHDFTPAGAAELAWMAVFAIGFLPLLLLAHKEEPGAGQPGGTRRRWLYLSVAAAAAGATATALYPSDLYRYLFAATPFILALVFARVARRPRLDMHLAFALVASIAAWMPFHIAAPDRAGYAAYYEIWLTPDANIIRRFVEGFGRAAPVLAAWAAAWTVAWIYDRRARGATRPTPPSGAG